jgi:hypothetical protein
VVRDAFGLRAVTVRAVRLADRPYQIGRALLAATILAGLALRFWQYFAVPALWLDELALVNGLISGPFGALFDGPADFAQLAPPGFLIVEWAAYRLGGHSEMALRAWSLLMGCGALVAVAYAARELVGVRHAWIATGLIALSAQLTFQSAQVKPYSSDAFFSATIIWLSARALRDPSRSLSGALIVVGLLAPWFALGTVFVLAGAGVVLVDRLWHDHSRRGRRTTLLVGGAWLASALAVVLLTRRLLDPIAMEWMRTFWTGLFPPIPPRTLREALWPVYAVTDSLWSYFGLRRVSIFAIVMVLGVLALWRRRPREMWILMIPIASAMLAAVIRQYPFGDRVALWSAPIYAILLAAPVAWVATRVRRETLAGALGGAFILATPALTLVRDLPPYGRDEIRPALAKLNAEAQPGDPLYVHWNAWHSWQFYGHRAPSHVQVFAGACQTDYSRGYLRELDALRGADRAWVLIMRTQTPAIHELMRDYLGTIGTLEDSLHSGRPGLPPLHVVHLYRYDLSDSARLASTDAGQFPAGLPAPPPSARCDWLTNMYRRGDGRMVLRTVD